MIWKLTDLEIYGKMPVKLRSVVVLRKLRNKKLKKNHTQQTVTCFKSTIKTLQKGVKCVQN